MGVDETNLSINIKKSTESSAKLAQIAAEMDSEKNEEEMLQEKIENLCDRSAESGTAVRMEMFELKSNF